MRVSSTEALADLRRMETLIVSTQDAATRLGLSESAASHMLRRLADADLVLRLWRGQWSLEPEPDPMRVGPFVTAPYPSYVSLWSALHARRLLSQVPRETYVISLGRPRIVQTAVGTFVVHRIAPELFGGFLDEEGVSLATPTKAVFDLAYLGATFGRRFRHISELDLSVGYRPKEARKWVDRIDSARLRTLVRRRLDAIEASAETR